MKSEHSIGVTAQQIQIFFAKPIQKRVFVARDFQFEQLEIHSSTKILMMKACVHDRNQSYFDELQSRSRSLQTIHV